MFGPDRRSPWLVAALITVGLGVAGCAATSAATSPGAPAEAPPARIAEIPGKDVKSVTLSEHAAKRLGVETIELAAAPQGMSVPYSAVFYTPDGSAWVYTLTQPLTYVREKVTVATVAGAKGDQAFLSAGPAVGTTIVKIGAIELYGAEIGVGGE
jgi:hypothetical protein